MASELQAIPQLDQKIRGLMKRATEGGANDLATIRGLARVSRIPASTLTAVLRSKRISVANQNTLARVFGFQTNWPEWRGTAGEFLDRFHTDNAVGPSSGTPRTEGNADGTMEESVAPKPRLAAELNRVAESAQKVIDEFYRTNFKDVKFPKMRVIEIAKTLMRLPEGSEDGALPALEYAESALTDLRFLFVEIAQGDELPDVPRGGRVDQSLQTLISDISTAKRFYSQRRLDAASKTELPDHALAANSLEQQKLARQAQLISEQGFEVAEKLGQSAETLAAQRDLDHIKGENLSRKSRDVATLTKQEGIEIGADRPRIAWLEKLDRGVEVALRGVELAAGVSEITVRKIGEVLIRHVTDWLRAARESAEEARVFIRHQKQKWREEMEGRAPKRRSASRADFSIFRDPFSNGSNVGPELVVIPAGEFLMGSDEKELRLDEGDAAWGDEVIRGKGKHLVRITRRFAIGRYPVTCGEYDMFLKATADRRRRGKNEALGSDDAQQHQYPVVNVSWDDAQAYCGWLNEVIGLEGNAKYRLPSESEWEYACRAGTQTRRWWGDQWDPTKANGGNEYGKLSPVDYFGSNPWGLYDMIGNVWEWVDDSWHVDYGKAPVDGSSWREGTADRIVRGGWLENWSTGASRCLSWDECFLQAR